MSSESPMFIYEVTTKVREDLCPAYEQYMIEQHIPDLLATGKFESASYEQSSTGRYRIRYFATTREALESYLADDTPRLRNDFAQHFPEGVSVSREEWKVLKTFA